MTGLFGTLNTSTSGMRAQQSALQTTSHNLANANTAGYSRQRVTMGANIPQSLAGIGQIGTGVSINGITRITDDFLTMQLQNEEASLTQFQEFSNILGQLEVMFNEPSTTGISHQMSEFFNSWNNLANNPESITSKTMVVRQAETFTDTVNHALNKMDSLSSETIAQIDKQVLDFNSAASQLKNINDQIANAVIKDEMPNDLLDKQDQLVSQMKNIAGVEAKPGTHGRMTIRLGNQDIVTENTVNTLQLTDETDGTVSVVIGKDLTEIEVQTGAIKGLQDAFTEVQNIRGKVDTYIKDLAGQINGIHNGEEGGSDFFTIEGDRVSVKDTLLNDPSTLKSGYPGEDGIIAPGDGTRAKDIFELQQPIFDTYNDIVTEMGIIKQQADNQVANQIDLTAFLEQRRDSVSGVDINEEVVNMIQFQSAFQANARTISTISEMLDTLINRMGV